MKTAIALCGLLFGYVLFTAVFADSYNGLIGPRQTIASSIR